MANQLTQIVSVVALAPGASSVLAHNINVNGFPALPDLVLPSSTTLGFTVTATTTTTITVRNDGLAAASGSWWLDRKHTVLREFNGVQNLALVPQPFIVGSGTGSGAATVQDFRFTATGAEGSDFSITLPAAQPTDVYNVQMLGAGLAAILGIDAPDLIAGDRTTTQFRVVTTGALVAGDQFDIIVTS
jgi:hypothetical protein